MTEANSSAAEATVRLTRAGSAFGARALRRSWSVLVDGHVTSVIAPGESIDLSVTAGAHNLQLRSHALLQSRRQEFDVLPGQIIGLSCVPRARHPFIVQRSIALFVASVVNHEVWIKLEPVELDEESVRAVRRTAERSALQIPGAVSGLRSEALPARGARSESADPTRHGATDHPAALIVEGLTKQFGARTAFSDVSFAVDYGEVFGFLGPNGAGKTTTVRTLGTLLTPSSGSAIVAGIPLAPENGVEIRQRIAIMPESPGLYLRLTVTENLEYFGGLYGLQLSDSRIKDALDAVNLADRAGDLCGGLSKGLRQRVGLARTLLSDPKIMFLDEPTSGLDPVAALEVHNLITGLRGRGVTIFLTTHRLDEAEKLCDRVAILNTTLRTVGRPAELRARLFQSALLVTTLVPLADPGALFSAAAGVESWYAEEEPAASYVLAVADPRSAAPLVTRALVGAGADVLSISEAKHSLEDVYLELIDEDVEALHR
jgi:ABC-2 type transport system ATP-binding protein